LTKAQSAMGSELVTLIADDDGVRFELSDINSDIFSQTFSEDIVDVDTKETGGSFAHRYPVKTLISLFKQNPDGVCYISQKGICKIRVSELDVYVLPQR
jgi:hypothetical protein